MKLSQLHFSGRDSRNIIFVLFAVLVLTVGLLLFYGYFSGYFAPQLTKIYYADNISPAHQIVIDRFNEMYADEIEIVPIDLPFIKFNTNLRNELLARSLRNQNNLIDVFAIDQVWNSRFSIWAEPLETLFPDSTLTSILPNVLANAYTGSHLSSMPMHTDVGVMYYRRDMVQKIDPSGKLEQKLKRSISWNGFIQLGMAHGSPNNFYAFQGSNYEGLTVNFMEIMGPSYANNLFNLETLELNSKLVEKGRSFLYNLIHIQKVAPTEVTEFNEDQTTAFALNNDTPFFRGWPSLYRTLQDSSLDHLFGIAALPHSEGEPAASVLGGWNLMISRHSNVKPEAALFLNYMISEPVQEIMLKEGGYLPVISSLYSKQSILSEVQYLSYLKHLVDNGFYRPSVTQYIQLSQILAETLHAALSSPPQISE